MTVPREATCAIAVMAKAPQPGRSKTRLIPPLLPEQAAALSAAFLRDVTENIALAAQEIPIHGFAAYAPLGLETLFNGHLADRTGLILADGSVGIPPSVDGFGRCLLHAIQTLLLQNYGATCVLNSDSPNLPTSFLVRAAQLLAQPGDRAVLGPAEDGGYYLLGLKTAHAHLFEDIAWSTDSVARDTAARAEAIGLPLVTLPVWYDVDDAASLNRLAGDLASPPPSPPPYAAPATRACLARFDLFDARQDPRRRSA
jgi:rSAM/selenodomain-associated transferase 1